MLYVIGRALEVVSRLMWLLLQLALSLLTTRGRPELVTLFFEHCGGGVLKLGQLLATRYDVLPGSYVAALERLLHSTQPIPWAIVRDILDAQSQINRARDFSGISEQPIASASIAQVHEAWLSSGQRVVIKVRRPGIKRMMDADIRIVGWLFSVMLLLSWFKRLGLESLREELERDATIECDFIKEALNARTLRWHMKRDDVRHTAPRVYTNLSSEDVIVFEFLDGVRLDDVIRRGQSASGVQVDSGSITKRTLARTLARSTLTLLFRHHYFQADPHPANIIVMKNGTLGYVDFGMIGWIDERTAAQNARVFEALAAHKPHAAYEALSEIFPPRRGARVEAFEREVKVLFHAWIMACRDKSAGIQDKSAGLLFLNIIRAAHRQRMTIPWGVARVYRALFIADMVVHALDPTVDSTLETARFWGKENRRRIEELLRPDVQIGGLIRTLADASRLIHDLGRWVHEHLPDVTRQVSYAQSLAEAVTFTLLRFVRIASVSVLLVVVLLPSWAVQLLPASWVFEGRYSTILVCLSAWLLASGIKRSLE